MAIKTNLLNNIKCERATCPQGKPVLPLPDGDGLYLMVYPSGSKNWVLRFSLNNKKDNMGLGGYPKVSLQEARFKKDANKKLAKEGINPKSVRDVNKLKTSSGSQAITIDKLFELLVTEKENRNVKKEKLGWTPRTAKRNTGIYDLYLKAPLGKLTLDDLDEESLTNVIESIYNKVPNSSAKARYIMSNLYKYAKAKKLYRGINLAKALEDNEYLAPPEAKHHPEVDTSRLGELLVELEIRGSKETTKLAIYIMLLTILRVNSLLNARWSWIKKDFLEVPPEFEGVNIMKNKLPFRCPLPTQALAMLDDLKKRVKPKANDFIFTGEKKGGHISNNVPCVTIQRILGSKEDGTAHGVRTSFNRVVSKSGKFEVEKIESQFTHNFPITTIRKTYLGNEDFLDERKEIIQWYADWLDQEVAKYKNDNGIA